MEAKRSVGYIASIKCSTESSISYICVTDMSVLQHARHCLRRGKSSLHQRARRLGRQKKAAERQKAHAGDDIWCFHDVPEVQALEPCWVSHISACTGEPKLHVACGRCRRQYVGTPSCSRELQLWVGYTCCFILHTIKQSKAEKYNKSHTDKKKKCLEEQSDSATQASRACPWTSRSLSSHVLS